MKSISLIRPLILAISILAIAGCATKPLKSSLIQVFPEGQTPEKPYSKVRILTYTDWPGKDTQAMNYFIRKAEKENADAIMILPSEGGGIGGLGYKKRWRSLAIRWK